MALEDVDASDADIRCECNSTGCPCRGTGRAWCSVLRDGKRLRICSRCDLSTDEERTPLTTAHLTVGELEEFAQRLERDGTKMVELSIHVARIMTERKP